MQKMQTTHYIYLHDGGGNLGKYLSNAWNMIPSWGQPVKCKYCLETLFFVFSSTTNCICSFWVLTNFLFSKNWLLWAHYHQEEEEFTRNLEFVINFVNLKPITFFDCNLNLLVDWQNQDQGCWYFFVRSHSHPIKI